MFKLVNITSKVAIRTVTPKICGTHKNVLMSTGDILKCICMRAHVEEILPDGSTVVLNSNNYNKNNTKKIHYVIADEMIGMESTNTERLCGVDDLDTSVIVDDVVDPQEDVELVDNDDDIGEELVTTDKVITKPHNNHNNKKKNKKKK